MPTGPDRYDTYSYKSSLTTPMFSGAEKIYLVILSFFSSSSISSQVSSSGWAQNTGELLVEAADQAINAESIKRQ